ncbi:hypothetical protein ABC733_15140 [Mangrovibacter sp. SLW1]
MFTSVACDLCLTWEKRSAALRIQLLEVVDQLYHQAVAHQLVSAGEFKVLFRWLENAGSSEKVGQPRPPVEPVEPVVQPDHSAASKPLLTWRARCLWGMLGGLVAVIFTGGFGGWLIPVRHTILTNCGPITHGI